MSIRFVHRFYQLDGFVSYLLNISCLHDLSVFSLKLNVVLIFGDCPSEI